MQRDDPEVSECERTVGPLGGYGMRADFRFRVGLFGKVILQRRVTPDKHEPWNQGTDLDERWRDATEADLPDFERPPAWVKLHPGAKAR